MAHRSRDGRLIHRPQPTDGRWSESLPGEPLSYEMSSRILEIPQRDQLANEKAMLSQWETERLLWNGLLSGALSLSVSLILPCFSVQ
jgi:hypothetical protein